MNALNTIALAAIASLSLTSLATTAEVSATQQRELSSQT